MRIRFPLRISDQVLAAGAFLVLPLLAVLIVGRFELRPHHYSKGGVAIVLVNYAIFSGGAYLIARAAGFSQRTKLLTALVLGLLFCAALIIPSIKI